jgi:hypothetical protein
MRSVKQYLRISPALHRTIANILCDCALLEGLSGCGKCSSSTNFGPPTVTSPQVFEVAPQFGYLVHSTNVVERVTVLSESGAKVRIRLPSGVEEERFQSELLKTPYGKDFFNGDIWNICPYGICSLGLGQFSTCARAETNRCQTVGGHECSGSVLPLDLARPGSCQKVEMVWESLTFRRIFREGAEAAGTPDIPLPQSGSHPGVLVLGRREGEWQEGNILSCSAEGCVVDWKGSPRDSSVPVTQLAALPPSREFSTEVGRYVVVRPTKGHSPVWTVGRVKELPTTGVVTFDETGETRLVQTRDLVGVHP